MRLLRKLTVLAISVAATSSYASNAYIAQLSLNNLYFGIDTGYSISAASTNLSPDYPSGYAHQFKVPNNTTFQTDIGSAGMIGVLLGYKVNSNVSLNVNYDYRGNYEWQVISSLPNYDVNNELYKANTIDIQTLMFNITLNPTVDWNGFVPFVFAGIGASWNKIGTLQNIDLAANPTYNVLLQGRTRSNFAWNTGVGADYAFSPSVHFSLAYRFVSVGQLETSTQYTDTITGTSSTVNPFKANNVFLNEFVAGLTWNVC